MERAGRLLLHLREAEAGLTEAELAFRAAEPVAEELEDYQAGGILVREGDRYRIDPELLPEMDRWVEAGLPTLGQEGRLFFSYGRTLDPAVMGQRAPSARYLCRARLPGYMLGFPRRSRQTGQSTCGVLPVSEGEGVWGVLYLVNEAALKVLDTKGGVPWAYKRRTLPVVIAIGAASLTVPAAVHLPLDDRSGGGPPRRAYLEKLIRGARAWGLPGYYVEVLEGTETEAEPADGNAEPGRSKCLPLVNYLDGQGCTITRPHQTRV